jgi:hypothetical protein
MAKIAALVKRCGSCYIMAGKPVDPSTAAIKGTALQI